MKCGGAIRFRCISYSGLGSKEEGMSFAIVTDSIADLSAEECAHYGIDVVQLTVEVGGESFKDRIDISSEEFYDKMIAADELPKSSQPSPAEFIETYERLLAEGASGAIAIHLAAPLSGTIESSSLAASQVDIPVTVVDSLNACSGEALLAIQASLMREAGATLEATVEYLEQVRPFTRFFIACGTLENLLKNGRLSAEEVDTATLLDIKPMMSFDDQGVLRAIDKAKGMNGVIKKYVEKLQQLTEEEGIQRVRFCHSRNLKGVEKLKKALADAGVEYVDYGTCSTGATVSTHIGLKALGMGTMPDSLETRKA